MEDNNLYVPDKKVKTAKSSFAIYNNEQVKYEGKDISLNLFAMKIQSGFFQAIDIEIINAVYLLNYATSRQITSFLNLVRNIDVDQNKVSKRLSKLNNSSVLARYSFISDERINETGTKCYVLRDNGKKLLIQREYTCNWNVMDCDIFLDNIKNYLAFNNYMLKLLKTNLINFDDINFIKDNNYINCMYLINNYRHFVITSRNNVNVTSLEKALTYIDSKYGSSTPTKIIFIGEDDVHLFNIFKSIILIIQNKVIPIKYLNNIVFTQDLRIIERNIDNAFIKYKLEDRKAILEDIYMDEFKQQ